MKKKICVYLNIFLALIFNLVLFTHYGHTQQDRSGNPEYIFYKGNALYEKGAYDEAIGEFSNLLDQGVVSGNLYYNIGNSYFKKGDLGMAILYYEKARRLIPRDSDLKSNYNFARSEVKYDIVDDSIPWFKRIFHVFNMLSINEMTVFLSALYALTMLFLISRLFIPAARKYSLVVMSGLLIFVMLISVSLYQRITLFEKEAVVIAESAEAGFEPVDNATIHFTLYEGMKINILQSKKEWVKIRRPDGKIGWVKKSKIEMI